MEGRCEIGVRRETSDASFTNDERGGAFGQCVGDFSSIYKTKWVIYGDHDRVAALEPGTRPKVDGCSKGLTVREVANGLGTVEYSPSRDELDAVV